MLRAADESDRNSYKRFFTTEAGMPPELWMTYSAPGPAPIAPADGGMIVGADPKSLTVPLEAASLAGATKYVFEVARDAAFTQPVTGSGWVAQPSWTVPSGALRDGAKYFWRVAAGDDDADLVATEWSAARSFTLDSYQLGRRSSWAFDDTALGSGDTAGVNLATGNLVVDSPVVSLPTVGEPLALAATYNSHGSLLGAYVDDRLPFGADVAGCTPADANRLWDAGRRFSGVGAVVVDGFGGYQRYCFRGARRRWRCRLGRPWRRTSTSTRPRRRGR